MQIYAVIVLTEFHVVFTFCGLFQAILLRYCVTEVLFTW